MQKGVYVAVLISTWLQGILCTQLYFVPWWDYQLQPRIQKQIRESPTSSPGPLVILLEMDRDSRSDPGGHRKVLPFDWPTEEQKIFVNYYDYAALIRSQLQRTLNCLKNREFTTRTGTTRNNILQLYCIKGAIKYIL